MSKQASVLALVCVAATFSCGSSECGSSGGNCVSASEAGYALDAESAVFNQIPPPDPNSSGVFILAVLSSPGGCTLLENGNTTVDAYIVHIHTSDGNSLFPGTYPIGGEQVTLFYTQTYNGATTTTLEATSGSITVATISQNASDGAFASTFSRSGGVGPLAGENSGMVQGSFAAGHCGSLTLQSFCSSCP